MDMIIHLLCTTGIITTLTLGTVGLRAAHLTARLVASLSRVSHRLQDTIYLRRLLALLDPRRQRPLDLLDLHRPHLMAIMDILCPRRCLAIPCRLRLLGDLLLGLLSITDLLCLHMDPRTTVSLMDLLEDLHSMIDQFPDLTSLDPDTRHRLDALRVLMNAVDRPRGTDIGHTMRQRMVIHLIATEQPPHPTPTAHGRMVLWITALVIISLNAGQWIDEACLTKTEPGELVTIALTTTRTTARRSWKQQRRFTRLRKRDSVRRRKSAGGLGVNLLSVGLRKDFHLQSKKLVSTTHMYIF